METIFSDCTTTLKSRFFAKSDSWVDVRLEDILAIVGDWGDDDLSRGAVGVHLKPVFLGLDGKKYYWPCLDIEDRSRFGHGDIAANIEVARQALSYFEENWLLPGLKVMLTGHGFRFIWPILIPHEYSRAFLTWIENLLFVDPGPYNNGFVRLIAYRGHTGRNRQDKGNLPPDIHTQLLNDPTEIYQMTEADYRRSVKGRLPSGACAWIDDLLPREFCSSAWINILSRYQARQRLRDAIIRIPRTRTPDEDTNALEQAKAHLDGRGITYTEQQTGDSKIFKLSECPACGEKDAGAWITQTGRLKHWTTRCHAGERDEQGGVLGIPATEWIPGFDEAVSDPTHDREFVGVDDSRRRIAEAINSDDDLLITATPGAGKTTTTLMGLSEKIQSKRVVFAVPTKAKAEEVFLDAGRLFPGANVRRITGRGKRNCSRFEECQEVTKQGFSPWAIVCFRCPDKKCDTCKYLKQFEDQGPGLVVTTHDAAGYFQDIEEIVIDEDSTSAIYREKSFTIGELMAFQADFGKLVEGVQAVFGKITGAAEDLLKELKRDHQAGILYGTAPANIKHPVTIREAAGLTDADMDMLGRLLSFFEQWPGESIGKRQWRLYSGIWGGGHMYQRGTFSMKVLTWLETLLTSKGAATIEVCRRPNGEDPFRFAYTQKRIPDVKGRLIVLDGTGDKADYDRIFNRDFRLVDATVSLGGCRFIHHQQGLGKGRMDKMTDKELAVLLAKACSYLKPENRHILIATHMTVEDRVKGMVEDAFPGRTVDVIHFNGSRGLNAYQDLDAVILLGTTTKNPVAAWKRAVALYADSADIADCIKRQSDAENIQTLHRVRPVKGGKTIIIMGREWFPGLPVPDSTKNVRRGGAVKKGDRVLIDEAYARINGFYQEFGFITKGMAWHLGVGSVRERAFVEDYHRQFQEFLAANTPRKIVSVTIYSTFLYSNRHNEKGCLLLGDHGYWKTILDRLKADHPNVGTLETSQGTERRTWAPGVGTVEKARAFYHLIGTEDNFKPELWRQVSPERVPIPDGWLSMQVLQDKRGVATIINFRGQTMTREMPWDHIPLAPLPARIEAEVMSC